MTMKAYPNRVRAAFTGNSTNWNLIGSDGTGYATYTALVAAGADPFPGPPTSFPRGVPKLVATNDNGSGAVGAGFQIVTNTRVTPTIADEYVSQTGENVEMEDANVTLVWLKKTTGGDVVHLVGYF